MATATRPLVSVSDPEPGATCSACNAAVPTRTVIVASRAGVNTTLRLCVLDFRDLVVAALASLR